VKFFSRVNFVSSCRLQSRPTRTFKGKLSFLCGLALGVISISINACGSSTPQLSVKLHNPKTGQTLFCSASNSTSDAYSEILASAVETCARQLEAQGFVRER
jgi:hypothetical protein